MSELSNPRRFKPEQDFPAYIDLLNAAAKHEGNEITTEVAQREFAELLTIDLHKDRFVVSHPQDPSGFIAACDVWQISMNLSAEFAFVIHPDWQDKGLKETLLAEGIRHAKELGVWAMDAYARPEQKEHCQFLERHGFKIAGNFTAMEIALEQAPRKAQLPKSFKVKTYAELNFTELEKLNMLVKAANEFWGDLWGHKVTKDLELARQTVKKNILPHFSEDAMFFLFDGETYMGHDSVSFAETAEGKKRGHWSVPGLDSKWRKPELAFEFALLGLAWLFEQGCRQISFQAWGESEETLELFKAFGLTITTFELGYQLVLKTT